MSHEFAVIFHLIIYQKLNRETPFCVKYCKMLFMSPINYGYQLIPRQREGYQLVKLLILGEGLLTVALQKPVVKTQFPVDEQFHRLARWTLRALSDLWCAGHASRADRPQGAKSRRPQPTCNLFWWLHLRVFTYLLSSLMYKIARGLNKLRCQVWTRLRFASKCCKHLRLRIIPEIILLIGVSDVPWYFSLPLFL